ncbi:hypothetical protein OAT97_00035 [Gammaproteobacteria bacterium]|nr:hypothetical protein [Gammaproteobacteria bacterium]
MQQHIVPKILNRTNEYLGMSFDLLVFLLSSAFFVLMVVYFSTGYLIVPAIALFCTSFFVGRYITEKHPFFLKELYAAYKTLKALNNNKVSANKGSLTFLR